MQDPPQYLINLLRKFGSGQTVKIMTRSIFKNNEKKKPEAYKPQFATTIPVQLVRSVAYPSEFNWSYLRGFELNFIINRVKNS